jgi:hypothetical protein
MNKSLLILLFSVFSFLGTVNIFGMTVVPAPEDHILIRTTILGLGTEIVYDEEKKLLAIPSLHRFKKLPSTFRLYGIKPNEEYKWITNRGVELMTSLDVSLEIKKNKDLILEMIKELGIDGIKSKEWMFEFVSPLLSIAISQISREFSMHDFENNPKKIIKRALEIVPYTGKYLQVKEAKFSNIQNIKIAELSGHLREQLLNRFT